MIDSTTATYVLIGFLIIFGIILPILDKIPKIKNFVSLRWTLVIVYSALCIGVVIDFEHLDNSVRFAIVIGGIVLSALFVLVRSIEKTFINNWKFPHLRTSVSKGDVSAELSVNSKIEEAELTNKQSKENSNKSEEESPVKPKDKNRQYKLKKFVLENSNSPNYNELMNNSLLITDDPDETKHPTQN